VGWPSMARLPLSLLSPLFCTKPCLPARLARFSARFFRAYRAKPAHLDPLQAGLEQKNELAVLNSLAQFSYCAWRAQPKTGQASSGLGSAA
jgi:hypothetical protein